MTSPDKGHHWADITWTPEELAAWLTVALDDRDAAIWVLAATTGMRRSELAGADRDLHGDQPRVEHPTRTSATPISVMSESGSHPM